jgi:hypothetical protein
MLEKKMHVEKRNDLLFVSMRLEVGGGGGLAMFSIYFMFSANY